MQKLSAGKFHGRCSTKLAPLPTNNNIEKWRECPLLAQSGHHDRAKPCPLLGVKRTLHRALRMSAFDPKRTSTGILMAFHCFWPTLLPPFGAAAWLIILIIIQL